MPNHQILDSPEITTPNRQPLAALFFRYVLLQSLLFVFLAFIAWIDTQFQLDNLPFIILLLSFIFGSMSINIFFSYRYVRLLLPYAAGIGVSTFFVAMIISEAVSNALLTDAIGYGVLLPSTYYDLFDDFFIGLNIRLLTIGSSAIYMLVTILLLAIGIWLFRNKKQSPNS